MGDVRLWYLGFVFFLVLGGLTVMFVSMWVAIVPFSYSLFFMFHFFKSIKKRAGKETTVLKIEPVEVDEETYPPGLV